MASAVRSCFKLLRQAMRRPLSLAVLRAGNSIAARMPIMAITTSNSIKVKPDAPRTRRSNPPTPLHESLLFMITVRRNPRRLYFQRSFTSLDDITPNPLIQSQICKNHVRSSLPLRPAPLRDSHAFVAREDSCRLAAADVEQSALGA